MKGAWRRPTIAIGHCITGPYSSQGCSWLNFAL
jgi:hypothetical protein